MYVCALHASVSVCVRACASHYTLSPPLKPRLETVAADGRKFLQVNHAITIAVHCAHQPRYICTYKAMLLFVCMHPRYVCTYKAMLLFVCMHACMIVCMYDCMDVRYNRQGPS